MLGIQNINKNVERVSAKIVFIIGNRLSDYANSSFVYRHVMPRTPLTKIRQDTQGEEEQANAQPTRGKGGKHDDLEDLVDHIELDERFGEEEDELDDKNSLDNSSDEEHRLNGTLEADIHDDSEETDEIMNVVGNEDDVIALVHI